MISLVILGGGKGARLKKFIKMSKILVPIFGKPLLEHNLKEYKKIKEKFLIINHKQIDIIKFIRKRSSDNVKIINEIKYLGDGGALYNLKKIKNYKNKDFLVLYGDLISSINYKKFYEFHKKHKAKITIIAHPNTHPFDSDLVDVDDKNRVNRFFFKPHKKKIIGNLSLAGVYIINGKLLENIPNKKQRLKNILNQNIKDVYIYRSREFIKDLGTPERLKFFRSNFNLKEVKSYNFKYKIPAIFLDRDGVINKENKNDNFDNPLNLFRTTIPALKIATKMKFLLFVITNQPAIAKGQLSFKKLDNMHKEFLTLTSQNMIKIYKIYFCPHHPEKGFKGEIKSLKINCNCRKPNNGLIEDAIKEFNINRKKSYFIGNHERDFFAAKKSKIKYLDISSKKNNEIKKHKTFKNLLIAIKYISRKQH